MAWREWGGKILFSHGSSNARGVAILFKSGLDIDVNSVKADTQGRFLVVKGKIEDVEYSLGNVYGPNKDSCARNFFTTVQQLLLEFGVSHEDSIVIGGDFNCPLNPLLDKKGGIMIPRKAVIQAINNLQEVFGLQDVWRIKNPEMMSFTWSQKSPFVFCRLDYWLTSSHLFDNVNSVDIIPGIKTDHSAITIEIQTLEQEVKGPGFWKLNVSLLLNKDYNESMERNIPIWCNESKSNVDNPQMSWEWLKYKIREFSLHFSKQVAREQRKKEIELISDLERFKLAHEIHPTAETLQQLENVKADLESYEEKKVDGIIVRARARWHEHGEKSSKYFLNLEKRNHIRKHIRKLNLSGVITTDPFKILEGQRNFYKDLYSSTKVNLDSPEGSLFFDNPNIPKLTDDFRNLCEGEVTIEEAVEVLKTFKDNKVPGNDGLPPEFYKKFWHLLGESLLNSFHAAFESGSLSTSQRQGVVAFIDKKDKDRSFLNNWRAISLLNTDVKILSKILAFRIKKILPNIIHSNQSGYVEGRYIGEQLERCTT